MTARTVAQSQVATWVSIAIAILVLLSPVAGVLFVQYGRLEKLEMQVQQAKLPEVSDRITRIEDDVRWMRQTMERQGKH